MRNEQTERKDRVMKDLDIRFLVEMARMEMNNGDVIKTPFGHEPSFPKNNFKN